MRSFIRMLLSKLILGIGSAGLLISVAGCFQQKDSPETTVSWLAPQTRAAKPADCSMPTLSALPNGDYQQLAIIEVADGYNASNQEVYDLAHRKACETGADALVILEDRHQQVEISPQAPDLSPSQQQWLDPEVGEADHKGRVLTAVAIIYRNSRIASDSGDGSR
jgi:hypothetical protein